MPYMLLIIEPPEQRQARTPDEGHAAYDRMVKFGQDLQARGLLVASESLQSHAGAKRVQMREGRPRVIDGPFAEAKEMIGGFFLLNCETQAEAVSIAEQCPAAEWCTVEVRALAPCFEESQRPA